MAEEVSSPETFSTISLDSIRQLEFEPTAVSSESVGQLGFEPAAVSAASGTSSTVTVLGIGLGVSLFVIAGVVVLGVLIVRVPG